MLGRRRALTAPAGGRGWRAALRALLATAVVTAAAAQGAYAWLPPATADAVALGAGAATLAVVYVVLRPGGPRPRGAVAAALWVAVAAAVAGARLLLTR